MKYLLTILLVFVSIAVFGQQTQKPRTDWAAFTKYAKQNAALSSSVNHHNRVVFLGSSIFEYWKEVDPEYFSSHPNYIGRGIGGQISPQILVRFRADVIDLNPAAVIILVGSNDISHDTTATIYKRIMDNIQSMVELAKYNNIKVILCTYLPIAEYPWRKGLHPGDKIIKLNDLITDYAQKENLILLDYYTPLVNNHKGTKAALTKDGVHPNEKGYNVMETLTEKAIEKAVVINSIE